MQFLYLVVWYKSFCHQRVYVDKTGKCLTVCFEKLQVECLGSRSIESSATLTPFESLYVYQCKINKFSHFHE